MTPASMRRWALPDGRYLAEDGSRFFRLTAGLDVDSRYEPRDTSVDDELWRQHYEVESGRLLTVSRVEHTPSGGVQIHRSISLDGLRELSPDEPPTEADVRAALHRHAAAGAAAESERRRRIRDLAGSASGARQRLAARVVGYDCRRSAALLDILGRVPRADDDGRALYDVLERAALLLTFAPPRDGATVRPMIGPAPRREGLRPSNPSPSTLELAERIERLLRDVVTAAEVQESVDALENVRAYRRAATLLDQALVMLGFDGKVAAG